MVTKPENSNFGKFWQHRPILRVIQVPAQDSMGRREPRRVR
jgi:hypothetical protein